MLYVKGSNEEFKAFRKSNIYKELSKHSSTIKIRYKDNKVSTKEQLEKIRHMRQNKHKNFYELFIENIDKEQDELLSSFCKALISKNETDLSEKLENILIITPEYT